MSKPYNPKGQLKPHRKACKIKASFWQLSHELAVPVAKLERLWRSGVLLPVAVAPISGLRLFDKAKAVALLKAAGDIE